MSNHLESMARRIEGDPFFLACALRNYAQSEELDDDSLAAELQCNRETLTMLRLCRAPELDRFKADIDSLVAEFQVNADVLVKAVRRGQAMTILKARQPEQTEGMLLAARDDDRPEPNPGAAP